MIIVTVTDQCPSLRLIPCGSEGLHENTLLAHRDDTIGAGRPSLFKPQTVKSVVLLKQIRGNLAPGPFVHRRCRQSVDQGGIIKSTLSAFSELDHTICLGNQGRQFTGCVVHEHGIQ